MRARRRVSPRCSYQTRARLRCRPAPRRAHSRRRCTRDVPSSARGRGRAAQAAGPHRQPLPPHRPPRPRTRIPSKPRRRPPRPPLLPDLNPSGVRRGRPGGRGQRVRVICREEMVKTPPDVPFWGPAPLMDVKYGLGVRLGCARASWTAHPWRRIRCLSQMRVRTPSACSYTSGMGSPYTEGRLVETGGSGTMPVRSRASGTRPRASPRWVWPSP